ncbi:hypothetical protein GP486_002901 [Trichoglossum hirsutum]|uniref:Lysozyme n=1 Tax=Trichoglossum hirsutum TaxID=265104 RepID=A0A9P8RRA5_9PEZI|nr:hypothetical protein GP486_002901 [Trichoglossum hirsutum]
MNDQLDRNLFLSQNQFDALCSFGYNGGPERFNHIVGFINDGHYTAAFKYMKTIEDRPLVKMRRYMEINLFNS